MYWHTYMCTLTYTGHSGDSEFRLNNAMGILLLDALYRLPFSWNPLYNIFLCTVS